MSDIVGVWEVPLSDKVHRIEFEHGTTTGKRIVRVDGVEVLRRDWMFKLVGKEAFTLGESKAEIIISATTGFSYEYHLLVDGKKLQQFKEKQTKVMKTWMFEHEGNAFRIVLEKESLDVWVNGEKKLSRGEFVEDGTMIYFDLVGDDDKSTFIKTVSSGNKKDGIVYNLVINGNIIPEIDE